PLAEEAVLAERDGRKLLRMPGAELLEHDGIAMAERLRPLPPRLPAEGGADGAEERKVVQPPGMAGAEFLEPGTIAGKRRQALVDEPRVAGVHGKGLVGRTVCVDRMDGEHLPAGKAGIGEETQEAPRRI